MAKKERNWRKPYKVEVWAMKIGLPLELIRVKHFETLRGAKHWATPWNRKHVPENKNCLYEEAFVKVPATPITKETV